MKLALFRRGNTGVLALVIAAPIAFADAPCNAGLRDVTAAERAQVTSVLQSAQAALPPATEGWIIVVDPSNEIFVPAKICRDHEATPWSYRISRTYRQVADAESRNKLLVDQAAAQRAALEARKPRMDADMAKYQAIMQQQMALNQKNDYAGAEKLQPQLEAAQKEYEALINEATDPAAAAATDKAFNQDLEMTITVDVNPAVQRAGKGATAIAPPSGAKSAQRWHVESESETNDQALYLFGAWKPGQGGMQPALRTGVAPWGAHGLSVVVTGDPARVTQTAAAIDFAKLAAIVR